MDISRYSRFFKKELTLRQPGLTQQHYSLYIIHYALCIVIIH